MDKLFISGLELWVRVGCTAAERAFPQRLEMDMGMRLDLRAAGRKDDIARTVDYADAVVRLKKAVESKTYKLAEAVAEDAAALVLKAYKVDAVTVRVKKRALAGID